MICDRGSAFTSDHFTETLESLGVQIVHIATGAPRANGQIERINRTITPMLSKLSNELSQWNSVLNEVEFSLNITINW